MEETKKYCYQLCQDEQLIEAFGKLHEKLVNEIISFCNEYKIDIDELNLYADNMRFSIPCGEWTAATDSSFSVYRHIPLVNKSERKPFLMSA